MKSFTNWTCLEPRARSEGMKTGLHARVHDPLWMLGRQWQFGEFRGEDAGSPVEARLQAEVRKLTRYHPGPLKKDASIEAQKYDSDRIPLETMVECEQIRQKRGRKKKGTRVNRRLSAEAGLHFLRLLKKHKAVKYGKEYINHYIFQPPTDNEEQTFDGDSLRFLKVMSNRVPDGISLYNDLKKIGMNKDGTLKKLPNEPKVAATHKKKVIQAASEWRKWYETLFTEPAGETSPWISERMEYAFAVSAPSITDKGKVVEEELVLNVPEYVEGHLDWYSFNVSPGTSLGAKPVNRNVVRRTVIPTPVTYRGMPAARWWEFEDAQIDFGAVEVGSEDLIRLFLIEFALTCGNDWFIIPFELDVGSVCQIKTLVVTDTFGERTLIKPYNQVDGADSSWRMFNHDLDRYAGKSGAPQPENIFFLPPVLPPSLHSPAIEEVLFMRDEMANMAWAIERVVESPIGKTLKRFEAYQERKLKDEKQNPLPKADAKQSESLTYRLSTNVPDYWSPLLPVKAHKNGPDIRLKLGSGALIHKSDGADSEGAFGKILGIKKLSLYEEEVPRAGAKVTRAYQYARWLGGATHLWIGRRKQPGRGEGSSGLRFDIIEPI